MAVRAKYKENDKVEFWFAGSIHSGVIQEVRKDGIKVSYRVEDTSYKYPVPQEKITKKL